MKSQSFISQSINKIKIFMPKSLDVFLIFLLVCFVFSTNAWADFNFNAYLQNQKAIASLKKSDIALAQSQFLQALDASPFSASLHLNLGLTYQLLSQMDKAEASYKTALKFASNDLERFLAYFNLGFMSQKAQQVDQALSYYQLALQYNPTSAEVKTNIELMLQDEQGKKDGKGDKSDNKDKDKDKNNNKDSKDNKDQDNKDKDDQNKDDKDQNKDKDGKDQKDKEQEKKYDQPKKPQPKPFKSEKLDQGDVKKILGEIGQQEQKIRAEFNRKGGKEKPRDKDW